MDIYCVVNHDSMSLNCCKCFRRLLKVLNTMKVAILLLSVLLACNGSRLREGFNKLFKREPKKCDIIWTEQIHPHCEITHEKVLLTKS